MFINNRKRIDYGRSLIFQLLTIPLFIFILNLIAIVNAYAQDTLIFAIDIIRHGDRTPIAEIPTSPHKWIEGLGQLTSTGRLQEYQLGKALRDKYVYQYHLLPENYSSNTMYVRSTATNRTLMSAEAFLSGLYPLKMRPKLPIPFQVIPIFSVPQQQDILLRPDHDEQKFNHLVNKYLFTTPEWIAKNAELKSKYSAWSSATGMHITQLSELNQLADTLFIYQLYNISPPKGLSKNNVKEIIKAGRWGWSAIYKSPSITTVAGIDLLQTIAHELQQVTQQNTLLKYVLFSAHDSTISTQMAIIGSPLDEEPSYAANLNFSLFDKGHQQYYVKVTYNSQPVFIQSCGQSACTLEQFLQLVNQKRLVAKKLMNG